MMSARDDTASSCGRAFVSNPPGFSSEWLSDSAVLTCFEKQLICQDAFNFMPAESLDQNMHCRCQQPSLETIGSDVVETLGVSKPNIYSNGNPIQQFLGLAQDSG